MPRHAAPDPTRKPRLPYAAAAPVVTVAPQAPDPDAPTPPLVATQRARPSLSMIQADKREWQRHQRQRDAEWQHLQRLEAEARACGACTACH